VEPERQTGGRGGTTGNLREQTGRSLDMA